MCDMMRSVGRKYGMGRGCYAENTYRVCVHTADKDTELYNPSSEYWARY